MEDELKDTKENIIYVLSNPAMPGLIKVGKTHRKDFKNRIYELYTTSIPFPFECEYAAQVKDADILEKTIFSSFARFRINKKREFLDIEPEAIINICRLVEIKELNKLENQDSEQIEEIKDDLMHFRKTRRQNIDFGEMGIKIGSILTFKNDPTITISVTGNKKVYFNGREMSLTSATRQALGPGYAYNVAPCPYWNFGEENLRDIYNDTYIV